jgi:hypothetical protein
MAVFSDSLEIEKCITVSYEKVDERGDNRLVTNLSLLTMDCCSGRFSESALSIMVESQRS